MTVSTFNPILDSALFFLFLKKNCEPLCIKHLFGHFFFFVNPLYAAQFQHMVWHFQLKASSFQSQLSFLKLLLNLIILMQVAFLFFENLANRQVLDSGKNKKVEDLYFFCFFEGHFFLFLDFFFSPHVIVIFTSFFSPPPPPLCSIAKILAVLQVFETLLAPLFYFDKTHFYSMFLKSTLPIFNVSGLGQLSDLFLRLVFPPAPLPLLKY